MCVLRGPERCANVLHPERVHGRSNVYVCVFVIVPGGRRMHRYIDGELPHRGKVSTGSRMYVEFKVDASGQEGAWARGVRVWHGGEENVWNGVCVKQVIEQQGVGMRATSTSPGLNF